MIELRSRGLRLARLPRRVPEKTQHAAERLPPGARRISSRFRWRKALPEAAAIKKDSIEGIRLGPFSAVARPPPADGIPQQHAAHERPPLQQPRAATLRRATVPPIRADKIRRAEAL